MLSKVFPVEDLRSTARSKREQSEFKSISKGKALDPFVNDGWQQHRQGTNTVRLARAKTRRVLFEDRVWSLLYKLGFSHLSGEGGAELSPDAKTADYPCTQIHVVGLDSEVAVAIKCMTADTPRRYSQFNSELSEHAKLRQAFGNSVARQYPQPHKRTAIIAMFTWDLLLSDAEVERAKDEKIALLNEKDLTYYELLVSHLGEAAKYQFFADMLPGRRVPGLELRIPALQSKLGKYTYYTFAIEPEYLLKIAYDGKQKEARWWLFASQNPATEGSYDPV